MEKVFFISDVHLGHGDDEWNRKKEIELIKFLDLVGENSKRLFIVGDFFDVWFEYRQAVPRGFVRTLGKLAELVDSGVEVNFIPGNHDFWIRDYFEKEIGMKVFLDSVEVSINGKKFYILHGDGLSKNDFGYRILKKILRNRTNIFLFSLIHPDFGLWLAKASSRKSREYSSNRKYEEKDMIDFASQKISEGFDYVVMGHSHRPGIKQIGLGFYVNLGDWLFNFTYGVFDEKFEIKKWEFERR